MATLKKGSKGKAVEQLQLLLSKAGYLTPVDGDFGPTTLKNLKAFQADNSLSADGQAGPITLALLESKSSDNKPKPTPVSPGDTPWMDWCLRNVGQKEITGSKHNQFIVDLFKYTSYKTNSDETPWCAAAVSAALRKNGMKDTNSAAAASYKKYGTEVPLTKPQYGDVLVLSRGAGKYHVTFYYGKGKSSTGVQCLGGNQSNSLKISVYSKNNIVAVRRPVKI